MNPLRLFSGVALLLAGLGTALAETPVASGPREIGYIEDVVGDPAKVVIVRAGASEPVTICMTIYNDDIIRVPDARHKVIVRLAGTSAPIERTFNDNARALHVDTPAPSFLNNLVKWAAVSISHLDTRARGPVAMAVRSGQDGPLVVPMFKETQVIGAGQRSLWIGWQGAPSVVTVEISPPSGQPLLNSRATNGLWRSPPLDLRPGTYRITVKAGSEAVSGTLRAVAPAALPQPPAGLKSESIPPDLRRAAEAAWLGSQGNAHLLEALQLVAASADTQRPAGLLSDAFIAGTPLDAPP